MGPMKLRPGLKSSPAPGMMAAMKGIASLAALAVLAVTLGACASGTPDFSRDRGYGERCSDMMRFSFPGGKLQLAAPHVSVATTEHGDLGLMIVDVAGTRPDIPASGGFLAREVAARCRFENGVLTQFRWTKGPYRVAP